MEFLIVLWMFVCCQATDRQVNNESQELLKKFREEAPRAWSEYRDFLLQTKGTGRRTERSGSNVRKLTDVSFWMFGDSQKYIMVNPTSKAEAAQCRGSAAGYWFSLRRQSESEEFVISRLDHYNAQGETNWQNEQRLYEAGMIFTLAPCVVQGQFLPDLIASPGFMLRELSATDGGSGHVELSFDLSPDDPNITPITNGKLVLSMNDHWSVIRYDLPVRWGSISGAVDYGDGLAADQKFQLPTRVSYEYWDGQAGQSNLGTNVEFEFRDFAAYIGDDADFTLKAFGVTEVEPPGVAEVNAPVKQTNLWIWFVCLSFVFAVLAVVLHRRNRNVH